MASKSERVQVGNTAQFQPVPLNPVAVKLTGSVSVTVAPVTALGPALVTVIV